VGLGGADLVADVPTVSVVVPVRDRRLLLRGALEALAKQTYRDFEVVVVDDGSTDGSGDVVADFSELDTHVVRTEGIGAVEARRAGVAAARGGVLAFTDSDCIPDADWLAEGVAAIEGGADLVQGPTFPVRSIGLLERSVGVESEDGLYATCNIFYRRDAYERAGGFALDGATRFGFRRNAMARGLGFGEDTLLGWRVRASGRAVFVPQAIVRHEVTKPALGELMKRAWLAGAFPSLVREVPELRNTLLKDRVFLGRRRIPLYATLVALLLRRGWLAGLLAATWIGMRARDVDRSGEGPKRKAVALPVELGLDAITAAALITGSVRAGTIVL
jgi:glycosyltransferase involved in cell wall biosynthesis